MFQVFILVRTSPHTLFVNDCQLITLFFVKDIFEIYQFSVCSFLHIKIEREREKTWNTASPSISRRQYWNEMVKTMVYKGWVSVLLPLHTRFFLCCFSFSRYWQRCVNQIYRALYGDAMGHKHGGRNVTKTSVVEFYYWNEHLYFRAPTH